MSETVVETVESTVDETEKKYDLRPLHLELQEFRLYSSWQLLTWEWCAKSFLKSV